MNNFTDSAPRKEKFASWVILCLSIFHQIYQRVSKDLMAFGIKAEMGAGRIFPSLRDK